MALAALPLMAKAEGAMREFDCVAARYCTETGDCVPSDRAILFRLEPQNIDQDGAGTYLISYGDVTTEAHQTGAIGPILWAEGANDKQSLMPLSEGRLLWHRLDLAKAPESRVIFLNCEVTR